MRNVSMLHKSVRKEKIAILMNIAHGQKKYALLNLRDVKKIAVVE